VAEYEFPANLKYSAEDEWARAEGDRITVGITDYAQSQLGDIVFVELPEVGRVVEKGEPFGVIESVKAVSDLYAPVAGEIVEVNADLTERPEQVNEDCYGDGWIVVIAVDDENGSSGLLDANGYRQHVESRTKES
jgi:glycine cleavage system H protein